MENDQLTLSISSNNQCYLNPVNIIQEVPQIRNDLSVSCSTADVLDIFVNQNLVYSDTLLSFAENISAVPEKVFNVLINTIKSFKRTQDYNGTYIAYLSGQLSEEDFVNEAHKYACAPLTKLDIETLGNIKILFETTNIEFTPSDISDIFHLDIDVSSDAITKLEIPVVEKQSDNFL
jgi:hypothetical protein